MTSFESKAPISLPSIGLQAEVFGFDEMMLTRKHAGVGAVDVGILNALLVGGMRMDRCLTEEEKHQLYRVVTQVFNCFRPSSADMCFE